MKSRVAILVLAKVMFLSGLATAQDDEPPADDAAIGDAAEGDVAAEAGGDASLGVDGSSTTPADVEEPQLGSATSAEEKEKEPMATFDIYLTFMPFVEYIDVSGVTPRGFIAPEPGHVGTATADYNGVQAPPRVRMTSGTSHIGFRGSLKLHEHFKVLGQMETAVVIDGDANPWESEFPNRNSFLGVTGGWGTLAFGRLDTPYWWTTLTTTNPIPGGYVADYSAIIGSPGFLAQSINAVPRYTFSPFSNAAFLRREANSIQYWSPELFGLSLRGCWVTNEFRPAGETLDDGSLLSPETNPFIASAAVAWELMGIRLRYAFEWHHDYFGAAYIAQATAPSSSYRSSDDFGQTAVAQYTLTINDFLQTRILGIGEYLSYSMAYTRPAPGDPDTVSGAVDSYARPAFYALLQQTFWNHHVWGAYGRGFDGTCTRIPQADGTLTPCSTAQVGAEWMQLGYKYDIAQSVQAYFMAYRLVNSRSAVYVTTPPLSREGLSPGYDQLGVGIGMRYTFGANLLAGLLE